MGAKIPAHLAETELDRQLKAAGLQLLYQGKVRNTWELPTNPALCLVRSVRPAALLMVASDRLSIFDIVLPCEVPDKGRILTALTVFWLTRTLNDFKHHLIAYGSKIDEYLPESLRGNQELRQRAMIVKKVAIVPIECIVRGYLTGSGWRAYQKTGEVCGHKLPAGLHDGSKLPEPIFTPSTKAETGHDEHVTAQSVRKEHGARLEVLSLQAYQRLSDYCWNHGVVLADIKFEWGQNRAAYPLADEIGTPDSSRFWGREEWEQANSQRKAPSGFDKEPVRQWGMTVETPFLGEDGQKITGINSLNPENPEHLAFVHSLTIPSEVIKQTTKRYRAVFEKLTHWSIEEAPKHL